MGFSRKALVAVILILAVSGFLNYSLYNQLLELNAEIRNLQQRLVENSSQDQNGQQSIPSKTPPSTFDDKTKTITAVAVRQILTDDFFQTYKFEGALIQITVELNSGNGKILVNTDTPTGVDFQSSARTAVQVSEKLTNTTLSGHDVVFSITSEQTMQSVDGQSAGAAMAILLISELAEKEIRPDVLITGTINPDGSIGRVGGISEKSEAAGKYGAKIFLVPRGQSTVGVESCEEKSFGGIVYRNCRIVPADLSEITREKYEMDVKEVKDIEEAISYFEKV